MNDEFIIERGTPPPKPRLGYSKYPLDQLQPGECMKVRASAGALRQAVRRFRMQRTDARRFTVRDCVDGYSKVYRLA